MFQRFSDFMLTGGPIQLVEGEPAIYPKLKTDLSNVSEEPELEETDRYYYDPIDEYYAAPTVCKQCNAQFIAYDKDNHYINNFCPGCGRKLKVSQQKRK